ncbi:tricarboxylate transport protein [Rhexocercosporidium sp. MPI-PUGE-AT-0058]|nr:tricarboxylate transport protein [Rhexocercosporidium sp. MPI-PUGE-AT-0058]
MDNNNKPPVALKLFAGGIAGVSETFVTYPAEFIKTHRQLPNHSSIPTAKTSSLTLIRNTYNASGLLGFYSGCSALATSNFLKSGIRFFAFETSRDYLDVLFKTKEQKNSNRSPWVNVLAGLSAGVAESLAVVTPGEALKTRLVQDAAAAAKDGGRRQFAGKGVVGMTLHVVRTEGISALWRGALPVMSKQATNSAVRFTVFASMQERVKRRWPEASGNMGTTLAMGALSGVVTVYASMPFDNVKTRMQSTGGEYTGMLDCAAKTLKRDGIWAFWRGTSPRLVRLTLSSGIAFTVYDKVVQGAKLFQRQPLKELQTL